jgi:transcriptional regulator with GAF, ATPase, and Fis domain
LFLDEVAEMSPSVQAKFLRVLQEREYQRLGSTRTMKADVRVLAATNRDLKAAIGRGTFAKISTIGSPSSTSRCRRCAIA